MQRPNVIPAHIPGAPKEVAQKSVTARLYPNGRAITYGNRVYVVDQIWGTRGVEFYNSASEMPKDMRDNVKSGPLQKKLKFKFRNPWKGFFGGGYGSRSGVGAGAGGDEG